MKRSTKCILGVGLAVLLVPFGVGLLYVHADNVSGQDVLDDTRYSAIGFDFVNAIIDTVDDIRNGELPSEINPLVKNSLDLFAQYAAEDAAKKAIDSANKTWGYAPNYTIQSTFIIMGKRRMNYPNGDYEVDTCILYRDKNTNDVTPQQFGQYTVAPNTLFLVRDTTWSGVIACSFPLGDGNNFQLETYNGDSACDVLFFPADNDTIVYDIASGRETIGFRHGAAWRAPELHFENNTTNTIVNNSLVDYYNNSGSAAYANYLPNYYMDNFEALLGTGYWYEGSSGFMSGIQPFYCTTAYFNGTGEFGSSHINDFFTTDPDNINPSKPPAYILPDNNPFAGGQTINNNTINNYADYGVTNIDGQLELNPDVLAGALGGLINPDFAGALGGVFDAQPQIGFGFDTPLDLNLPELVGDFLDSITVYPPATRPQVPVVTTFSEWNYLPSYTTQTFPVDCQEAAQVLADNVTGFTDSMGITSILLILALIGLMTYCIF